MSTAPQPYTRQTNFFSYEQTYPTLPKSGASLDAEFNGVVTLMNAVLSRLNEIQRDDGLIANSSVHPQALTSETFILLGSDFSPRGTWATLTLYEPGDLIERSGLNYLATVQHVSNDFDIDLAAGRWQSFGGYPTAAQVNFAPGGSVGSVSVQDAIIEIDGDVQGKQAAHANLTALAGLVGANDNLPYFTGAGTMALTSLTAAARTFLAAANAAAARAAIGVVFGTEAGQVPVLDVAAKLPAVDGSQLTNIVVPNASITDAKLAATLNLSGKTITLPAANTPVFTKSFESTQQTITAGGLLTIAHGLAVAPKLVTAELVCITGELNWVAGDRLFIACGAGSDSASNRGIGVFLDATNVGVRFGSAAGPLVVNNKNSGATAAITPANWKLVIRAYA